MIIVCYKANGMKFVLRERVTQEEFDRFCESEEQAALRRDPSSEFLYADRVDDETLEVTDERQASSVTRYKLRPDDWPIENGEPR